MTTIPPTGLWVATPCYGNMVTQQYLKSILKLQKACLERGLPVAVDTLGNESLVTRARNTLVATFLDRPTFSHMLFIDADIAFEPEAVFRLLDSGHQVVGGIYPIKWLDWGRIAGTVKAGHPNPEPAALHYAVDFEGGQIKGEKGFARARYVATGFLMMARPALERMRTALPDHKINVTHVAGLPPSENHYAFFDTMIDPESRQYLSEDYAFCRRWAGIGGEIWVDLTSKLTHIGSHAFQGDLSAVLQRR